MSKFTKEQAIEALKAKIPAKDKDLDLGRTISEAVDNSFELIGEESEMELNDFVEKVWKQVKTSIGLTHSENSKVAQKLKDQIAELQQKLDGKEPPKTGDKNKDIEPKDPALKKMREELDEMKRKMETRETEETVAEKRRQLVAKMSESIKDTGWIDDYLAEINITAETDVEAKAKDYVAFYNKTHVGGGKVTPKKSGSTEDHANTYVKSVIADAASLKKQRYAVGSGATTTTTE